MKYSVHAILKWVLFQKKLIPELIEAAYAYMYMGQ